MKLSVILKNKYFDTITEKTEKKVESIITKGCLAIEADAKKRTPVDTGNLRASITHNIQGLKGEVGTNVEYASYVEYGTFKQDAQPYLLPALKNNEDKIQREIDNIFK